ncbi:tautomerase family protein [Microbacterium sp. MMO-64]|uniref:tautomerase family protein n=1 Tax=Microbacterium sp. MMO-64 TaxID=3081282 RepID=UPI00301A7159
MDCFAGRSRDAKRKLYAAIVERLSSLGIPGDHVSRIVHDIDLDNWGVGGGLAASDVDLGFHVAV